jgi:rod shape determining protein RodA
VISRAFDFISRRIDGPLMATLALTVALGCDRGLFGLGRRLARPRRARAQPRVALRRAVDPRADPPAAADAPRAPVYVAGSALLVGVALFGDVRNGARRWLNIGVTTIQPSEIMKIAVPLMLAWWFHRQEQGIRCATSPIAALLLAIPVGLIVRQPDLGTAILIFASGFFVIFLAGLSWKIIGGLASPGARACPSSGGCCTTTSETRAHALDPMQDPLGAGYHIIQSTIAIGSGGCSARGG